MAESVQRVAVIGSTGSIGSNALGVIAANPRHLAVAGLAVRNRTDLLQDQVARYQPALTAVWDEAAAESYAQHNGRQSVYRGLSGLVELATHPDVDVVLFAASGSDTLIPLIRAIQSGKRIALASKELLVMAGELVMQLVHEHGTSLVPVDSEHAALFQCLQNVEPAQVTRLFITGSGGALWGMDAALRNTASRQQVLAHPKWSMGPKITVDSATLMNKGLEVIEARWLFGFPLEQIQVIIHPEAVVHALVETVDGSLLAQMSPCDMRLPIQYALSFPQRWPSGVSRLDLTRLSALRFFEPDLKQFPCLQLALAAARQGGTATTALNGANEVAVRAYLEDKIAFSDIARVIAEVLEAHTPVAHPSLEEILRVDAESREAARQCLPSWSHQLRRFAVGEPKNLVT